MSFQQGFRDPQGEETTAPFSAIGNPQQTSTQMVQQQPLSHPLQPQCNICGTTQKLLRCAKCKAIYYCSTEHQHLDWPTHKQQCRTLAKQRQTNSRLQQLTSGCGAININAHSNANIASTSSNITTSSNCSLNCNISPAYDNNQPDSNAFVLGTHENEILNSKAEIVTQNSNSNEYVGNFDANSTTTDQMHLMIQNSLGIDVNQLLNDNSYYYQVNQQQELTEQNQSQYQNPEPSSVDVSPPSTINFQPQLQTQMQPQTHPQQLNIPQQQPYLPPQQQLNTTLQYPVPQLSNPTINQHEKSSSYQISTATDDKNLLETTNERRYEELCRNIINDMNQYGLSVVDDFLGHDKGLQILNEVHQMYSAGVFKDGQLVNNVKSEQDLRTIRGDKITWVKGIEPGCSNIGYLINQIDAVICRANSMRNNGKLGNYIIKERTKAMVACYPGSGSHYVMHVDNPNKDGRVITAIYYLNLNWDSRNNGGILRIFPEQTKSVADIEPKFDRLIFFWSDKRNPHEVQPAHKTRYAITVWYFDATEREQALSRCKNTHNSNNANISNSAPTSPTSSSSNTENKSSNIVNTDTNASANTPPHYSCTSSTVSTPTSSPSTSLSSSINDNVQNSAGQSPTKPVQVVRPNTFQ